MENAYIYWPIDRYSTNKFVFITPVGSRRVDPRIDFVNFKLAPADPICSDKPGLLQETVFVVHTSVHMELVICSLRVLTSSGSSRHDHDGRDRGFGHVWQEIMVSDGHHTNVIYIVTRKY